MTKLYAMRYAFVSACQLSEAVNLCAYRAEWLMLGGFNRALDEDVRAELARNVGPHSGDQLSRPR